MSSVTWRDKVNEYYKQPQPTHSGLTDEELRVFYKNFLKDDKPWCVAGELLALRSETEYLKGQLQATEGLLDGTMLWVSRLEAEIERLKVALATMTEERDDAVDAMLKVALEWAQERGGRRKKPNH
jgi:hypothetical protein